MKLEGANIILGDEQNIYKLLQGLDDQYDYIARGLENGDDASFMFENVKRKVINEYHLQRLKYLNKQESFMSVQT